MESIMAIIILIFATLLIATWLILLGRVTDDDCKLAAYAIYIDKLKQKNSLVEKDRISAQNLLSHDGIMQAVLTKTIYRNNIKKINKLSQEVKGIMHGDTKSVGPLVLPGYVILREIEAIGKGAIHKEIHGKCQELYGKKLANFKTKQILAKILSYSILGLTVSLITGVLLLGMDSLLIGYLVICIGVILTIVMIYAIYDELGDLVKKRRKSISKEFPNVVSKLALLVTSGMIMDRAWKETSASGNSELYTEMTKTSKELENLVSPEIAYSSFINRCNTKESAKLASAILQNLSKGNAEIGKLLKDMAREAWLERRHTAKRDAEKANSKLMIPTMLLFLAILVMLMVPVAMNFTGI